MALALTIADLLFAFGFIAQEVAKGKTLAFDRAGMLALRSSTDPSVRVGSAWLRREQMHADVVSWLDRHLRKNTLGVRCVPFWPPANEGVARPRRRSQATSWMTVQ